MWPTSDHMGGAFALYGIIWLAALAAGLTALWRGMRAQEAIVAKLGHIARVLERSRDSDT